MVGVAIYRQHWANCPLNGCALPHLCQKDFMAYETRKQYSDAEKMEILQLVEKLGTLNQVSKTTGVSRAALRKWADQFNYCLDEHKTLRVQKPSTLGNALDAQVLCNHAAFLAKAYGVKEEALAKLQHLIKHSNSLKDVTGALDLLHKITTCESPDPVNDKAKSVYEMIMNMQLSPYEEVKD